ncbi:MAG: bifunctional aspartate kinase/diaminopimelate decarboxylase [Gammaproteobacteria bacterium]|nr:bifunctional aspartate kinase/diaminopimelate decarboxylase [Gammaproteobacteria bacterium]
MTNDTQWQLLKFGGTSVSSRENWQNILNIVKRKLQKGKKVFIVHSALSGVSNQLEALIEQAQSGDLESYQAGYQGIVAQHKNLLKALSLAENLLDQDYLHLKRLLDGVALLKEASDRVRAVILAQGELLSTRIGQGFLQHNLELHPYWLDARQFLVSQDSDDNFLAANCTYTQDNDLLDLISDSKLVITQGFIASNQEQETVLTGRGGSDASAAYFSAKIDAERLEIWTDVAGIFTANPNQVHNARLLKQLDYSEAQEMSSAGAKVLHPRAIRPARDFQIPIYIRSTINPELDGTKISKQDTSKGIVKAITAKEGTTLISMESQRMWQQAGFLADLFIIFKKHQISIDLVSTSETNVTVTLDSLTQVVSEKQLAKLSQELAEICSVKVIQNCSTVSIVGQEIRAILHKMASALSIFETYPVYLLSQAASDLNLTFVLEQEHQDKVIAALHEILISNNPNSAILGPTVAELEDTQAEVEKKWWQQNSKAIQALCEEEQNAYVYSLERVKENAGQLKTLDQVSKIFFAVKANNNPEVLKTIYQQGLGFEAVSLSEIELLLKLFPEISKERIFFTPNFASKEEYQAAIDFGVCLSLDSNYPLLHWPDIFENQKIFLRIDPNVGKGHHENVRTAGATSKFGIPIYELASIDKIIIDKNIKVIGLHTHAGSGILTPQHWAEHARLLVNIAGNYSNVRYLNLGGGLGIKEKDGQNSLSLAEMNNALREVKEEFSQYDFWIEPGRYLVADAGVLVAKVTQVKQKQNYYYVGLNTGMNSLMRPALYGSYHPIVNLTKLNCEKNKLATIVGPICESTDKLGIEIPFPETEEGDLILIENAGAYGFVMSNEYNLRKPAQEVCLNQRSDIDI